MSDSTLASIYRKTFIRAVDDLLPIDRWRRTTAVLFAPHDNTRISVSILDQKVLVPFLGSFTKALHVPMPIFLAVVEWECTHVDADEVYLGEHGSDLIFGHYRFSNHSQYFAMDPSTMVRLQLDDGKNRSSDGNDVLDLPPGMLISLSDLETSGQDRAERDTDDWDIDDWEAEFGGSGSGEGSER